MGRKRSESASRYVKQRGVTFLMEKLTNGSEVYMT